MTTTIVDNATQSIVNPPPAIQLSQPWEKRLDESQQWHSRFVNLYLIGSRHNRSILQAYRNYRQAKDNLTLAEIRQVNNPPHSWYDAASDYDWRSRAAAYDSHIDSQLMANFKDNAQSSKANRIGVLEMVLASVAQYYASGEIKYDASSASATMKTAIRELRQEYEPTHKQDNRTQIIALIGQLPADVQSVLRKRLKGVAR